MIVTGYNRGTVTVPPFDTLGGVNNDLPRVDQYSAHIIEVHSRRTEDSLSVKCLI